MFGRIFHCIEVHPGYFFVRFRSPFDLDVRSPSHAFLLHLFTFPSSIATQFITLAVHALNVAHLMTIRRRGLVVYNAVRPVASGTIFEFVSCTFVFSLAVSLFLSQQFHRSSRHRHHLTLPNTFSCTFSLVLECSLSSSRTTLELTC